VARSSFSVTTTSASGTVYAAPAAVDAAYGQWFLNDGRSWIEIVNGSASAVTATFVTNGTYAVGSTTYPIADLAVTIAASGTKVCGPFDKTLFNSTTSTVEVNWSSGTSITARVAALGTS